MKLILASTSTYRERQLRQLGYPFTCQRPLFDEEAHKNQGLGPFELAPFLAQKKAESVFQPGSCVIGGDQLVAFENQILGKAGSFEKALATLSMMNGKWHDLITAVFVKTEKKTWSLLNHSRLKMRQMSEAQLIAYLKADEPYDCAGSYKIEAQGITLFETIDTKDFTAIQGLPLMGLTTILHEAGL